MITAAQVLAVLAEFDRNGISVWVDGGWGVDALLGYQSRPHDDLDLVIAGESVPAARRLLLDHGFVAERDWLPTALAMSHPDGRAVDLHPIEPSSDGGGDQIQRDGVRRWHYPPPVQGLIAGGIVRCCSVECQLAAHVGFEPGDDDRADMRRLAARFGVELPAPYADD